jgi:hypothetical protein
MLAALLMLSNSAWSADPLLTHVGAAGFIGIGSPGQSVVGGRLQGELSHVAVGYSLGFPYWTGYAQVNTAVIGQGSIPWVRVGSFGGIWDFGGRIGDYALVGVDLCGRKKEDHPFDCISVGLGASRPVAEPYRFSASYEPIWEHTGELYPAFELGYGQRWMAR